MLTVRTHVPRYIHSIGIYEMPQEYKELVREISQEDSYRTYDYMDGDYYYLVDLNLANLDTTPDDVLTRYFEDEEAPETYPFKDWEKYVYRCMELFEYVEWLRMVRYLVANLPEEVVTTNKFAIYVSH